MLRKKPLPSHPDRLYARHKAGSPIAVDEWVVANSDDLSSIPEWVTDELVDRSRRRIWEVDSYMRADYPKLPPISPLLAGYIPPKQDKGGRGRFIDYFKKVFLVAYVEDLCNRVTRVSRAFSLARIALADIGIGYKDDTIQRKFYEFRKQLQLTEDDIEFWSRELEEFLPLHFRNKTIEVSSAGDR